MAFWDLIKPSGQPTGRAQSTTTEAVLVADRHGRYYADVAAGNVYQASVASVATGSTVTTTAALVVYNPSNSGVNLAILHGSYGYISGTLGAGSVVWVAHNTAPPITAIGATAITPVNLKLDVKTQGRGYAASSATVPTGGTILRTIVSTLPVLATTAVSPFQANDPVEGLFVAGPGTAISIQGVMGAAGSTPLCNLAIVWEEVPLV